MLATLAAQAFVSLGFYAFLLFASNPLRHRFQSQVFRLANELGMALAASRKDVVEQGALFSYSYEFAKIGNAAAARYDLGRFGAEVFAVNLVAAGFLREIGILLTAIMVAGRSGSAFTAQIGSMKLREEIDAVLPEVVNTSAPRVTATTLSCCSQPAAKALIERSRGSTQIASPSIRLISPAMT